MHSFVLVELTFDMALETPLHFTSGWLQYRLEGYLWYQDEEVSLQVSYKEVKYSKR